MSDIEELNINVEPVEDISISSNEDIEDVSIDVSDDIVVLPDKNYLHTQTIASDTWIIVHNLNKYPAVSVMNSAGEEVVGEVTYDNVNQVTIKFVGAFKGIATLN